MAQAEQSAPTYRDGPAHALDHHPVRMREADWDLLTEIASIERRSRKAQITVVLEHYVKTQRGLRAQLDEARRAAGA